MEPESASFETTYEWDAVTSKTTMNDRMQLGAEQKPHIVFLHYSAPPLAGGVEHVLAHHVNIFQAHGYQVTIAAGRAAIGADTEPCELVLVPELDCQNDTIRKITDALNSDVVLPEFRRMQAAIEEALERICGAGAVLIAHNVLSLHLNFPLTAAVHHLLDAHALGPVVAWCHDVSRCVNPTSGVPLRFGFPWDLLRTYRSDVRYVAVSRQRQRILAHALGCPQDQIRVIPDGIDPQVFGGLGASVSHLVEDYDLLSADLILLMPVRITRAKNIKRALEILASLKDMGLQVRLIVTGPLDPHKLDGTAYFKELLALRHKLSLEREVVFALQGSTTVPGSPAIESAEASELYRVCDLLLLTSSREGFGIPILEAGLAAMPIFTTEVPALEEFEPGSVNIIERGELPAQVAKRIKEWAATNMSHRLRRHIRRDYTWSAIFRRHIEPLLQECITIDRVRA